VALFRGALGEESPRLADAMTELANALERLGQLDEAESTMRRALAMHTKLLGPDHPDTANTIHNLVNVLHDRGKNAEAEKLMTGLVAWQRGHDPQSPALGFNLAGLGGLKRVRGDWHGADADFHEALEIFRKAFGEHHSTYGRGLTSLATNRIALNDLKTAEIMLNRAVSILRTVENSNPLDLSFPLVALGQALLLESRPAEAEKAARESYDLRRKLLPQTDSRVALAESVLGGSLAAQHRFEEAEPLLIESHRNLLRFRGDRAMQPELARLAQLYRSWK
jgi:tetratricopeptide (TPR) repeat protein